MSGFIPWLRRFDDSGIPLLLARVVLGATFIYMGSMKLGEPIEFLKQIRLYDILPETPPIFLNAVAIVLPWLEIVFGVAMLIGLRLHGAAAGVTLLMLVFTPAILVRGLHILDEKGGSFFDIVFDCGCGTGPVVIWSKILENVGLLVLALLVLLSRSRRYCLELWLHRSLAVARPGARDGINHQCVDTPQTSGGIAPKLFRSVTSVNRSPE